MSIKRKRLTRQPLVLFALLTVIELEEPPEVVRDEEGVVVGEDEPTDLFREQRGPPDEQVPQAMLGLAARARLAPEGRTIVSVVNLK